MLGVVLLVNCTSSIWSSSLTHQVCRVVRRPNLNETMQVLDNIEVCEGLFAELLVDVEANCR